MEKAIQYSSFARESQLLELIEKQARQLEIQQGELEVYRQKIAELEALVKKLQKELEEAKRNGQKQATPFSRGKKKENPKKPGRKAGEGNWSRRSEPEQRKLEGPSEEVKISKDCCPECGGKFEADGYEEVSNVDLPKLPQPEVRKYRVEKVRCLVCKKSYRGEHPDIAEDQTGATAHRVGARALAAAHTLHYGIGIPVRKVPQVLDCLTGLSIGQSAITQDAKKKAKGLVGKAYESIKAAVKSRPVTYTDSTGWKVAGEKANLAVFDTDRETVFTVNKKQSNEEVRQVIPPNYKGVMETDRASCYDAEELSDIKKQKCLAHIQKNIKHALLDKKDPEQLAISKLKPKLSEAISLWHAHHNKSMPFSEFLARGAVLSAEIGILLQTSELKDPDDLRLIPQLAICHSQGNLLRFLQNPLIEPTNNRAERGLRPAVIARKISQCSKNSQGAYTFSAFKSIWATFKKLSIPPIDGFTALFQGRLTFAPPHPL